HWLSRLDDLANFNRLAADKAGAWRANSCPLEVETRLCDGRRRLLHLRLRTVGARARQGHLRRSGRSAAAVSSSALSPSPRLYASVGLRASCFEGVDVRLCLANRGVGGSHTSAGGCIGGRRSVELLLGDLILRGKRLQPLEILAGTRGCRLRFNAASFRRGKFR